MPGNILGLPDGEELSCFPFRSQMSDLRSQSPVRPLQSPVRPLSKPCQISKPVRPLSKPCQISKPQPLKLRVARGREEARELVPREKISGLHLPRKGPPNSSLRRNGLQHRNVLEIVHK